MILAPGGVVVVASTPGQPVILPAPETGLNLVLPVAGPKGDPGRDGVNGSTPYIHRQDTASAQWHVEHHLGWRPQVLLFLDEAPNEPVWTDTYHVEDHTVLIELPEPATGTAYLR